MEAVVVAEQLRQSDFVGRKGPDPLFDNPRRPLGIW